MKFFKWLAQNVSVISEQQENLMKRPWKLTFKNKKKRLAANDKVVTPSSKSRGLPVQFGLPKESCSSVKHTPQGDSPPPKPVCANNSNRMAMFKIQKYLDSIVESNESDSETDESSVLFINISETDSDFEGGSDTPKNRRVPRSVNTFKPAFFDRFDQSLTNGTIIDCLARVGSEKMASHSADADSRVDNVEDIASVSIEDEDTDVDADKMSSTGSDYLDAVVMRPHLLFQDCDYSQTVETYRPTSHTKFMVTVIRGDNGFGFSFGGQCPPRVTKVERDSPAEQAGVRKGDLVLKMNSRKLNKSTSESAADFIKTINPEYLSLELKRYLYQSLDDSAEDCHKSIEEMARGNRGDDSLYASTIDYETGAGSFAQNDDGWTDQRTTYLQEMPKEATAGVPDDNLSTVEDERGGAADGADAQNDDGLTDQRTTYLQDMSKQATGISKPSVRPSAKMPSQTSDVMAADLKHKILHRLMSLEDDYINFMQYGIEEYSRPMRCILSRQQHMTIFQNVEKLVRISEWHVKQIRDRNASITADIRDSHMMCQAYEMYAQGFERSKEMIKEIKKENGFSKFVTKANNGAHGHLSVTAFLNKPILHIQELYKVLREMLVVTPKHSEEFDNLQMTIDLLSQCVTTSVELSSVNRNQDVAPSPNNLNAQATKSDKTKMAYSMNIQLSESSESINITDIQDELIFASSLQDGNSCVENMPLIYEGNVHKCNKKGSWITYKLLLFSELILVASEDLDGFLFVSDSPILIEDLAGLDTSREHDSEFVLHLRTPVTEVSHKQPSARPFEGNGSTIIFRASSTQDKFLWKSLLQQRVAAVTGSSVLHCVIPTKPV